MSKLASLSIPVDIEGPIRAIVRDEIARATSQGSADDWVDQDASPIGRVMHMRLARTGVLASRKVHRRILVRRSDLNAYIEAAASAKTAPAIAKTLHVVASPDDALLAELGAKRAG